MADIQFYDYFRSSSAYRVRIALKLKKLDYESVQVHLVNNGGEQYKPEFMKLNPLAQIPVIVHNGVALSQSVAIIDYLEHLKPEPILIPKNPFDRAKSLEICEAINSGIQPLQNASVQNKLAEFYQVSPEGKKQWLDFWMGKGLKALEVMFQHKRGRFYFGEEPSIVECFLIPQLFSAKRFGVPVDQYKNLLSVEAEALKLDAFQPAKDPAI